MSGTFGAYLILALLAVVALWDAVHVHIAVRDVCPTCRGERDVCPTCGGYGTVER